MARKKYHTDESAKQVYFDIVSEFAIARREAARKTRPLENALYVANLPERTLKRIHAALDKEENKKKLGQRLNVPHNIIVYIWEHRNE